MGDELDYDEENEKYVAKGNLKKFIDKTRIGLGG